MGDVCAVMADGYGTPNAETENPVEYLQEFTKQACCMHIALQVMKRKSEKTTK